MVYLEFFILLLETDAHAVLQVPLPFNPNPSKTGPCGGASFSKTTSTIYRLKTDGQLPFTWNVIAGDGGGTLSASIDPLGGTNFTLPTSLNFNAPTVGQYSTELTLPSVSCTKNNPCTMQIKTSANWFSCFLFETGNYTAKDLYPSMIKSCASVGANTMTYCQSMNNNQVVLPETNNFVFQDSANQVFYNSVINNTNVMVNGTNELCQSMLKNYICGSTLQYCGTSSHLTGMDNCYCESMKKNCGITESHDALFNCSTLPTINDCKNTNQIGSAPQNGGLKSDGYYLAIFMTLLASYLLL
ncbi:hypothetical protein HDV02_003368 [Globomyces sp. JEL0801]|nr:hypothetical protein HDV02_003368 [Globomyces sp. JEL0801]